MVVVVVVQRILLWAWYLEWLPPQLHAHVESGRPVEDKADGAILIVLDHKDDDLPHAVVAQDLDNAGGRYQQAAPLDDRRRVHPQLLCGQARGLSRGCVWYKCLNNLLYLLLHELILGFCHAPWLTVLQRCAWMVAQLGCDGAYLAVRQAWHETPSSLPKPRQYRRRNIAQAGWLIYAHACAWQGGIRKEMADRVGYAL